METYAVIDPACFIWDEADFQRNSTKYYQLIDELIGLLEIIEEEKPYYVIRPELIDELTNGFPAKELCETFNRPDLSDILYLVYNFLSKINVIDYESTDLGITSLPELSRNYFSAGLKNEINFLINQLSNMNESLICLTINEVWPGGKVLRLFKLEQEVKTIEVLNGSNETHLFFKNEKRIFEPSPKHKEEGGWGTILPKTLEEKCYSLIHTAIKDEEGNSEALYEYCSEHDQYVIFRVTVNNIYHAYPISAEEVPSNIKRALKAKYSLTALNT